MSKFQVISKLLSFLLLARNASVAILITALSYSMYVTYVMDFPAKSLAHSGRAWVRDNKVTIVEYTREFVAYKDVTVDVHRTLRCKTPSGLALTFDLSGFTHTYLAGHDPGASLRAFEYPLPLPQHTECELDVRIAWKPEWALVKRIINFPSIYIEVVNPPQALERVVE